MTNPDFHGLNKAELEAEAARLSAEAARLETFADETALEGYEPYAEDVVVSAFRELAAYMRRDADEARAVAASTLIPIAPAAPWIQKWAAEMRVEAALLERSASSLEEVVIENERMGFESWTEDMAADVYRRLAAYLRRDAAAGLEHAKAPQITEIDEEYIPWQWTPDQEGIDAIKKTAYSARIARAAAQAAHDAAATALDTAAHLHREGLDTVAEIVSRRDVDARDIEAANNALKASYADLEARRATAALARDELYDACEAVKYAERRARADAIDAARKGMRPAPRRPEPGTLVVFCTEETFASTESRRLMTIEEADKFASIGTGEKEWMRFNEDVRVPGSPFGGASGYSLWIEEETDDIEF